MRPGYAGCGLPGSRTLGRWGNIPDLRGDVQRIPTVSCLLRRSSQGQPTREPEVEHPEAAPHHLANHDRRACVVDSGGSYRRGCLG
jgi:hypothetical protein